MKQVLEYQRKITDLKGQGLAMLEKADKEGRALNADEKKSFEAVEIQIKDTIAMKESREKMLHISGEIPHMEVEKQERGAFKTFGEQLLAVRDYTLGRRQDTRLMEQRTATGLNESIPSEGGFLVQKDFASELIKDTYDNNEIPNRCRKIQISGPSNSFSANMIDETSRATGSRMGGVTVIMRQKRPA